MGGEDTALAAAVVVCSAKSKHLEMMVLKTVAIVVQKNRTPAAMGTLLGIAVHLDAVG